MPVRPVPRYAPWLAIARQYFEHRAECATCRGGWTLTCDAAQRLCRQADDLLRSSFENDAPASKRSRAEAAS